jgi:hypothetical protein
MNSSKQLTDESGNECPTREEIRQALDISESTIKRYVSTAAKKELIELEGKGNIQKVKVVDIPEVVSPLPAAEELLREIGDPVSQIVQPLDNKRVMLAHAPMSRNEPMSYCEPPDAYSGEVDHLFHSIPSS